MSLASLDSVIYSWLQGKSARFLQRRKPQLGSQTKAGGRREEADQVAQFIIPLLPALSCIASTLVTVSQILVEPCLSVYGCANKYGVHSD